MFIFKRLVATIKTDFYLFLVPDKPNVRQQSSGLNLNSINRLVDSTTGERKLLQKNKKKQIMLLDIGY